MSSNRLEGTAPKKRKNAAGQGSVRKRYRKDGSEYHEARLMINGKQWSFSADKEKDALALMNKARQRAANREPLKRDRLTTGVYLTSWLEAKRNLKPRTRERYRQLIELHIIPAIGHIPLEKLEDNPTGRPTDNPIAKMYWDKEHAGLSKASVHHLHAVLHVALEDAKRHKLVYYNATELVIDPPQMPRRKVPPFTHEEAQRLLAKAREPQWRRWYALFVLALTTGLRQGELLALRWDDVHLDAPEPMLKVDENLYFLHGAQFGAPKSEESKRSVLLIPRAVEALQAHEHLQKSEKVAALRWDKPGEPYNLIFPNTVGMPVTANNFIVRVYHPLLVAAGLPNRNFHQLRHTTAIFLLKAGVPDVIVAKILGHEDPAFTKKWYGYNDDAVGMQQPALDVMNRLFGEDGPP